MGIKTTFNTTTTTIQFPPWHLWCSTRLRYPFTLAFISLHLKTAWNGWPSSQHRNARGILAAAATAIYSRWWEGNFKIPSKVAYHQPDCPTIVDLITVDHRIPHQG